MATIDPPADAMPRAGVARARVTRVICPIEYPRAFILSSTRDTSSVVDSHMVSWLKKSKIDGVEGDDNDMDAAAAAIPLSFPSQQNRAVTRIRKMQLNTINDIASIQGEISGGNLAIIDVSGFITSGEFSILELKRAIEQIRGTCKKLGGAIARLGDRYLVATPSEKLQLVV
ncbi:MAG: cell division protein SepF [Candidatus Lokiarchaeota archaeon]|nr:cell division protein SepF [Candidatus Lokiarchaeota archaeon]